MAIQHRQNVQDDKLLKLFKQIAVEVYLAIKQGPLWLCILYVLILWGPLRPLLGSCIGQSPAKVEIRFLPEMAALWLAIKSFVAGLVIPIILLTASGRSLRDTGLGPPDYRGVLLSTISLIIFIPIGFWLSAVTSNPWQSLSYEFFELVSMIPEHFLVFGVIIGLIAPMGKRMWSIEKNCVQQAEMALHPGIETNKKKLRFKHLPFSTHDLLAIIIAGSLFGLIHLGYTSHIETTVSFPVGVFFAFITLYSASIWPALIIHWFLNLIPMTVDYVLSGSTFG